MIFRSVPKSVVVFLLASSLSGCGNEAPGNLPETHEASGTVVDANNKPLSRGMIEFKSKETEQLTIRAVIDEKGNFEATTQGSSGNPIAGAPAGTYTATVTPFGIGAGVQDAPVSVVIGETITVPSGGTNSLQIRLPAMSKP